MMKSQGIYTELKSILKSREMQMERTETDGNGRERTKTDKSDGSDGSDGYCRQPGNIVWVCGRALPGV